MDYTLSESANISSGTCNGKYSLYYSGSACGGGGFDGTGHNGRVVVQLPLLPTEQPTLKPSLSPLSNPPSLHPSSAAPTCAQGTAGSNCLPCPIGTFQTFTPSSQMCKSCPIGSISTVEGSTSCDECPWPSYTDSEGESDCYGFSLHLDLFQSSMVLGPILFTYLFCWSLAGEYRINIFLNMLIPMVDHLTDIYYCIAESFHSFEIFLAAMVFLFASSIFFFFELNEKRLLLPHLYYPSLLQQWCWLGCAEGRPTRNGQHLHWRFENHDDPVKYLWYLFSWISCIIAQLFTPLAILLWPFLYLLAMLFWLFLGILLYQTRTFCVGKIRGLWYSVWTQGEYLDENCEVEIDRRTLNQCLFATFLLETLPHLGIQILNNSLASKWNNFKIFSIAFSSYMLVAGIWKFVYWKWWKETPMEQVPLPRLIPFVTISWLELPPSPDKRRSDKPEKDKLLRSSGAEGF